MASIRREFVVGAPLEQVWNAVAAFGAVHELLARGFVVECALQEDGAVRALTFANGLRARERLVTLDAVSRRLVYAAEGGRTTHHNACLELHGDPAGTRLVWTTDLLPDELAPAIGGMMDAGVAAMQATLDGAGDR